MSTTTGVPATGTVSSVLAEPMWLATGDAGTRYWMIRLNTPGASDPLRTGDQLGVVRRAPGRSAVFEPAGDGRVALTAARLGDVVRFMALVDARDGDVR